ncbi:hypothetical protein GCM10010343_45280 [Streptomyces avidinii]|nr:hypothetical protein GCM10010343_45280 [Streptomyces avidinii]
MVVTGRLLGLLCGDASILAAGMPVADQPPCLFPGPLESDGERVLLLLWYDRGPARRAVARGGVEGGVGVARAIEIPSFPYRR